MSAHRPPQAEDGATRATLNYLLGNLGGRQKSWMTAGQTPSPGAINQPSRTSKRLAKPSRHLEPQPRMRPHPQPQLQSQQLPAVEPTHAQPLSNSTSPQLANVMSNLPNGHSPHEPIPVLPSPAPSEDASLEILPSGTAADGNDSRLATIVETGNNNPTINAHRTIGSSSTEDVHTEGARQTTAPKRPNLAGMSPTLANKRARSSNDAHVRPLPSPLQIQAASDVGRRVSVGHVQSPNPMGNQPFSPIPRQQAHSHSPYQSLQQQQPTPRPVPSRSTPPMVQNSFSPTHHPPLLAAQTWPSSLADLHESCLERLTRFSATNPMSPDMCDARRIRALDAAVKALDWDYLMIHLFYCLLTLEKESLPDVLINNGYVSSTEKFLGEVLDVNHTLMPITTLFFVRFPVPLKLLLQRDPAQWSRDVVHFANLMTRSANYFTLRERCDERGLPPLMHELVYDIGIRSKLLQRIVFTASIRRLWARWGLNNGITHFEREFEGEATRFFVRMQEGFYHRLHNGQEVQHERAAEFQAWVGPFANLRESYITKTRRHLQNLTLQTQFTRQPRRLMPRMSSNLMNQLSPVQQQNVHVNTVTHSGPGLQSPLVPQMVYPDQRVPPDSAQAAIHHGRGLTLGQRGSRWTSQGSRPQSQDQIQLHSQHQPLSRTMVLDNHVSVTSRPILPQSKPRPILPPAGHLLPQQRQPDPARFGLHQAHLLSPHMVTETSDRLYLCVSRSFLSGPQSLKDAGHRIEKWTFTLTPEQFKVIPKDIPSKQLGSPPNRLVNGNSFMFRLRCVKWKAAKQPDEHSWATSDTSWIPYSYFTLNGKSLEQRKKLQYGKDLPIDLTSFVKEGQNILEIAIVRQKDDNRYRSYLLAIEVLVVMPHEQVMKAIRENNHVSADTTKQRIMDKLKSATGNDDDEIAVINSNITIKLMDPFIGSKMCDIPVRSSACDHFECFDLLTYLDTRKREGVCTVPDHWKCPICNSDARPQFLFVDGFLEEVRKELARQGLLNTRAIIVSEDGSWKPKADVLEGVADPDEDDEPGNAGVRRTNSIAVPQGVEVIDLDD